MAPTSRTTLPFLSLLFGLNPLGVQGAEPLFFEISRAWRQTSYTGPADVYPDHLIDARDVLAAIDDHLHGVEPTLTPSPTFTFTPSSTSTPTPSATPTAPAVAWRLLHTDRNEGNFPNIRQVYGRINGDYFELRLTWHNWDDDFARAEDIGFQVLMNTDCNRTTGCDPYGGHTPGLERAFEWSFRDDNDPTSLTGTASLGVVELVSVPPDTFCAFTDSPPSVNDTPVFRPAQDTFDYWLPLSVLDWSTCIEMQIIMESEVHPGDEIADRVPDNLANWIRFP